MHRPQPDGSAPNDPIPEIIAEFSEVFAFARTRWARYAEEVNAELKGVGMMILQTVMRKGPVTATGLGQMLDMDKAVVSRQVSKLRELDLINAEPAAEDRRVILLTATTHAREALDELHERTANAYQERFSGWEPDELVALRDLLHRFNRTAEQLPSDGPAVRCAREHGGGGGAGGGATAAAGTGAAGADAAHATGRR